MSPIFKRTLDYISFSHGSCFWYLAALTVEEHLYWSELAEMSA